MIEFNKTTVQKFIKFGLVGLFGVIIDFGIANAIIESVSSEVLWNGIDIKKYGANSIGFICAATSNYFWNRRWTFQSTDTRIMKQYLKFISVSAIGLLLNNGMIYIFDDIFRFGFNPAKGIATIIVAFWNFAANYIFTFKAHLEHVETA